MNTSMAERNSSGHPTHIPFDGEIQLGSFVGRLNRFAAQVDLNGEIHLAHVPNSGRMSELLVKGAEVGVVARTGSGRKTRWDLAIVKYGDVWVSVDSRQANEIVHRLLRSTRAANREPGGLGRGWHQITAELTGVRREARVGRHIIDFLLEKRGSRAYLEVKSVNLVQNGTALFPDAPTKRGKEHVGAPSRPYVAGARTPISSSWCKGVMPKDVLPTLKQTPNSPLL